MNENIKEVAHHRIAAKAFELLLRGHSITTKEGGRGGVRGNRKSMLVHVTKGRYHVHKMTPQVGKG